MSAALIAAARAAQDALSAALSDDQPYILACRSAFDALSAALAAAPEQKPAAEIKQGAWNTLYIAWLLDSPMPAGTKLYTAAPAPAPIAQPLTEAQVVAAARALNKRHAELCNVNEADSWNLQADDFKDDARAALLAAGIGAQEQTRSRALAAAGYTRRPSLWAMQAREALELIAAPMRPDGTWNRDREACRQLAAEALGRYDDGAQEQPR